VKRFFLLLLFFIYSFSVYAFEYRWLEMLKNPFPGDYYKPHTQRQIQWLYKQDDLKQDYLNSLKNVAAEEDIREYWSSKRTLRVKKAKDLTIKLELSQNSRYYILSSTNSSGETNEIINSQNMGQLQAYGIYNEYILRNIYLSPGHKYLVVEVVKNRTTVVADFLIYKISDFSLPIAHIKDTFYTGFLWEGEDTIIYSPKLNFEYVFKYDLISGQQYYLPNNRKSLQSVLDTKIQYENDYIWLNGEEKPTQTLRLKHYETDVFDTKNISYLVSDEDSSAYLVPRLSNDKSILFSSGSRNPTHLVFVGYKEVENKEIKISNINAFKIPLKGSIQKYFKLGNHYLVVYLSGIKKRYYIFDEDGNLEIDLEAPIGKLQK
jgi:hypothetical protein